MADHVRRNVRAGDCVSGLGKEETGPTGAATQIEQFGWGRGQKGQHRGDLSQVGGAVDVAERLAEGVADGFVAALAGQVLEIIDFAGLGHVCTPPWIVQNHLDDVGRMGQQAFWKRVSGRAAH